MRMKNDACLCDFMFLYAFNGFVIKSSGNITLKLIALKIAPTSPQRKT